MRVGSETECSAYRCDRMNTNFNSVCIKVSVHTDCASVNSWHTKYMPASVLVELSMVEKRG